MCERERERERQRETETERQRQKDRETDRERQGQRQRLGLSMLKLANKRDKSYQDRFFSLLYNIYWLVHLGLQLRREKADKEEDVDSTTRERGCGGEGGGGRK